MSEFDGLVNENLGSQTEIDLSAARGGHDEETVLTLFRRLRAGSTSVRGGDTIALRDHLVMVHAPLVEHCARNYLASGEPMDDLIQEGYVGLIKAVDRFDPNKGIKFSTYSCHLISGEIRHYLRDLGRLIHEPGWHFELRQRVAKASEHITQQTGRPATPEEIASHLNAKVETVRDVLSRSQTLHVESLEAKNERDEGEGRLTVLERYEVEQGGARRGDEARIEDQLFLDYALPQLKELEQQAITLFFFQELSKTEIARQLGISVNYVSYLIKRGTEGLKRLLETGDVVPNGHSIASGYSQQQARAAYLLELAKGTGSGNNRRNFSPNARVPALARPTVSGLAQFAGWLDEEVNRVGRYGGQFSVLWFQIRNWNSITQELPVAERKVAAAAAAALVRRKCRGVDKVAAMQSADPAGLHFLVLLPATGSPGRSLGDRLAQTFLGKPDIPGVMAPFHTRMAYSICPDDARSTDEIFTLLGTKLAQGE
jgi:RNA polymerase sigma-B factor